MKWKKELLEVNQHEDIEMHPDTIVRKFDEHFHINRVLVLLICLGLFLGENRTLRCGLMENRVVHSLLPITFDIPLSGVLFLSHCALSRTHIRVETKKKALKTSSLVSCLALNVKVFVAQVVWQSPKFADETF